MIWFSRFSVTSHNVYKLLFSYLFELLRLKNCSWLSAFGSYSLTECTNCKNQSRSMLLSKVVTLTTSMTVCGLGDCFCFRIHLFSVTCYAVDFRSSTSHSPRAFWHSGSFSQKGTEAKQGQPAYRIPVSLAFITLTT